MNWRLKPRNWAWAIDVKKLAVVYDACILYPAPLRDLLMQLAVTDLYDAKWTDTIHNEWIRNVLKNRPDLTLKQLERTRQLMNVHVRDSLITGYEELISSVTLPDPKDRHVLAAAIHAKADLILTFNLKDFPSTKLQPYGIEARHPDDFLSQQLSSFPDVFCSAVKQHRASLRNPPKSVEEYLETLNAQNLAQTVSNLQMFVDVI